MAPARASKEPQRDEIAEAEQAVTDAERRVGEVEQALLDRKPGVSAPDLLEAEDEVTRRRTVVERLRGIIRIRTEREAERQRQAAIAELRRRIREDLAERDLANIIKRFDAAVASLVPLVEAIHDRNRRHFEAQQEMRRLGPLPPDFSLSGAGVIHVDNFVVEPLNLSSLAAETLWRAFRQIDEPGVRRQAGGLATAAGVGHAPKMAERYGMEIPNPRQCPVGPSDRLRWLAKGAQR